MTTVEIDTAPETVGAVCFSHILYVYGTVYDILPFETRKVR